MVLEQDLLVDFDGTVSFNAAIEHTTSCPFETKYPAPLWFFYGRFHRAALARGPMWAAFTIDQRYDRSTHHVYVE